MRCGRREARGREEGEGRKCKRREEGHKEGGVSWAGGGEAYPLSIPSIINFTDLLLFSYFNITTTHKSYFLIT